jgi:hypothetical protein
VRLLSAVTQALPHHTTSDARANKHWLEQTLSTLLAIKPPRSAVTAPGDTNSASAAQLEARESDAEHGQPAAAAAGLPTPLKAPARPDSASASWCLAAGSAGKRGVANAQVEQHSAALSESAASADRPPHQNFKLAGSTQSVANASDSAASSSSGQVSSSTGPAGHVATVAYKPLATGSSAAGSCNDFPASFISSEHATSAAAWKDSTESSQHATGSHIVSAAHARGEGVTRGAAGNFPVNVHVQHGATGQSLSGFSDLESLI